MVVSDRSVSTSQRKERIVVRGVVYRVCGQRARNDRLPSSRRFVDDLV